MLASESSRRSFSILRQTAKLLVLPSQAGLEIYPTSIRAVEHDSVVRLGEVFVVGELVRCFEEMRSLGETFDVAEKGAVLCSCPRSFGCDWGGHGSLGPEGEISHAPYKIWVPRLGWVEVFPPPGAGRAPKGEAGSSAGQLDFS